MVIFRASCLGKEERGRGVRSIEERWMVRERDTITSHLKMESALKYRIPQIGTSP